VFSAATIMDIVIARKGGAKRLEDIGLSPQHQQQDDTACTLDTEE
jgi:hypothetical protein